VSPRGKLLLLALILVGAMAGLWAVTALSPSDEPGTTVEAEGQMPVISGTTLIGESISPDLYRGKVVLVNFWATWCGPCREEQPALQRLWEEYQDRGVQFIGVDFMDDDAAGREYLREFGVTYPSVTDDGQLSNGFAIPYLPATVLVDRQGEMRYRLLGAQSEESLRGPLGELLAGR
jgi:thiol-disulfide isomerase/thioredoxin